MSMVGHSPFTSLQNILYFGNSSPIVILCQGLGPGQDQVSASPTHFDASLLSFVVDMLFI